MNGQTTLHGQQTLAPPLRTALDMPSRWEDVELDFDTAAERIIAAHKKDGTPDDLPVADLRSNWAIVPHEGRFALAPLTRHHSPKPLRANGFSNLMSRIGAPPDFVRRLPAALALATTNYLLTEHDDKSAATLRLRGGEVAAVVSDRYAPLDIEELVTVVRETLVRFDLLHDVRVRGISSGLQDNLRLVLPSETVALKVGDASMVSLDITTSSFARSAIRLVPGTFRLVCLNGMLRHERRDGLAFRHVGDTAKLRTAVAEAIPAAIAVSRGLMEQWQRAVTFMVEDVERQVEQLRLTNAERNTFESELKREAGISELPGHLPLYSFINALTSSAKSAPPVRRLELETTAGDVLDRHVGRA